MTLQFTSRPALPDDAEFLLATKKLAYREYVDKMGTWSDEVHRIKISTISLENIQIIEADGSPVGWFNVTREKDHVELLDIYILPSYQRKGIGTRIVRQLMVEAAAKEVIFQLMVLKVNPEARNLYINLGMKEIGVTETHHKLKWNPLSG